MLQQLKQYIADKQLLTEGEMVIVALSGGADSVALLDLLQRAGYKLIAAHCNFHLRAAESDRDQLFVEQLCCTLQVPIEVIHFQTNDYAKEHGISIEMAARELRYKWFNELCNKYQCRSVATGHHQNDQAETLMLNLMRGTGLRGLRGMKPRNGNIVRPLLFSTRQDICNYLTLRHLNHVEDSSNSNTDIQRNAIRGQLNRLTQAQIHHIANTAALMDEYTMIIDNYINLVKNEITENNKIDIRKLLSLPAPKTILYELIKDYGFTQCEDIYNSLTTQAGKCFYSSSHILLRDRDYLLIYRKSTPCQNKSTIARRDISNNKGDTFPSANELRIWVDADKLTDELIVRPWRNGDWFMPLGMNKRKKISDFLTDLHIPLIEKKKVEVMCSANNIIWVIGYRLDNRYKVTERTKQISEIQYLPQTEQHN